MVVPIAQLIKIQDYITRYEWDTFRYPTQYIRLKNENWNKLYEQWRDPVEPKEEIEEAIPDSTVFSKIKDRFKKQKVTSELLHEDEIDEKQPLPSTELELKQDFLDNLLNFQMKWATSTVTHSSIVDQKYYKDSLLKYLLQGFPDTFLLMYDPIFTIRKAPIEGNIIIITPIGIEIVHFVEYGEEAKIIASEERTWLVETFNNQRKILNPTISLKRTEKLIKSILAVENLEFAIKKTVLSRNNHINFATAPYNTQIIGKLNYDEWFQEKRRLVSPLKNLQIKTAEALLKHCQTTSVRRPEWEEDGPLTLMDMEE